MNIEILKRLGLMRHLLVQKFPFFEPILYSLSPVEYPPIKTMAVTNRLRLPFNPEWIETLSNDELEGVYFHEITHATGRHWYRLVDVEDEQSAVIAKELAVNTVVDACGLTLPAEAHRPKAYGLPESLSCEAYYELLLKAPEDQRPWLNHPGLDQAPTEGLELPDEDGGSGDGDGNGNETPNPGMSLDEGLSAPEIDMVMDQVRELAKQHIGKLPGELEEHLKPERPAGPNPWARMRHVIRSALSTSRAGNGKYSRRRPSKIGLALGMVLSGRVKTMTRVTVIIDTSGSMKDVLERAFQELTRIFLAFGLREIQLIQADAAVQEVRTIRSQDLGKGIVAKGFGGTDFDPAIQLAAQQRPRPQLIVYVTDGYGKLTCPQPVGCTTVFAITEGGTSTLPWGKVIELS